MDTGKLKNNDSYYRRYEGETEVSLSIKDMPEFCIHVWDGYFEDILSDPYTTANGWMGFTRDYQEGHGAWGENSCIELYEPSEYLADLRTYKGKPFEYEESENVLELLIEFLEWAGRNKKTVILKTA